MNCQEVHKWIRESDELNPPQAMQDHLNECSACSKFYSSVIVNSKDFIVPQFNTELSEITNLAFSVATKVLPQEKKFNIIKVQWLSMAAAAVFAGIFIAKVIETRWNSNTKTTESTSIVVAENDDYSEYIPSETAYNEYLNVNEK